MHLALVFSFKRGGEGDRPSAGPRKLLSPEVIRVKAIQVPALSREPRLNGVQPEVCLEPTILPPTPIPKLMSYLGSHENDRVHQSSRSPGKEELRWRASRTGVWSGGRIRDV